MLEDRYSLIRLRWQWFAVFGLYALAVWGNYLVILQVGAPLSAGQWLGLAATAAGVQLLILWWALPYNYRQHEQRLFPVLGYANGMTLTRGLLTCLLAGFLFAPQPVGVLAWAPALLYTLERLIDYFDGYVARITQRETKLGEVLDMEFDGLGILIAVAVAIQYGRLPAWYLLLGLGRQLFVAGMWLRRRWGKPVFDLPPSNHRRLIAGFQTSFISVAFWPTLTPQITLLAGNLFAIPLIFSFARDWLAVSGVIDAGAIYYQSWRRQAKRIVEGWLPVAARLLGAGLSFWLLGQTESSALSGLAGLAAIFMLVGIVGRLAALGVIALACVMMLAYGMGLDSVLLLICGVTVLHLGSGRWALWQPEEAILQRKLGAAQ